MVAGDLKQSLINGFDAHRLKKSAAPQTPHGFPPDPAAPAGLGPFPYRETSLTQSSLRPLSILEDEVVKSTYKMFFFFILGWADCHKVVLLI